MLVIKQMNGVFKVNATNLIPLHEKAQIYSKQFENIQFQHIYRQLNSISDELANNAVV
jgi:hypothetical protein